MSNCYYIVQDYIDNVTAHIRVGPPVYFIVKDYNYRYYAFLYLIVVPSLLLILTVYKWSDFQSIVTHNIDVDNIFDDYAFAVLAAMKRTSCAPSMNAIPTLS